jgi:hypothetical protein
MIILPLAFEGTRIPPVVRVFPRLGHAGRCAIPLTRVHRLAEALEAIGCLTTVRTLRRAS